MIIPIINNPAAQALALMIQKGGTLRLRAAELAPMNNFALLVEASEKNPEVMHIKTVTRDEAKAIMIEQQKAMASAMQAMLQHIQSDQEKADADPQS